MQYIPVTIPGINGEMEIWICCKY